MDPGLGLVVNTIVPNEVDVPKLMLKPALQLPHGFLDKPHVRHALKYMADEEQQKEVLEVAMSWKKKFSAEKWKPIIDTIEAVSKEDHVRSCPFNTDLHDLYPTVHTVGRPRAVTTTSTPAVPKATLQSTPIRTELTRLHTTSASLPLRRTTAPTTPRTYRWDVLQAGPVTPLSPMPIGNSFSGSGYWGMSTPQTEQDEALTPVTAIHDNLFSPVAPKDADARAIYETVHNDIDALARRYCLARHNMRSSGDNGWVPATMIISKDVIEAAQVALSHRKLKLKVAIIKDLPCRLRSHALKEAGLQHQLSIKDEEELLEQNDWMNDEMFARIPEDLDSADYLPPVYLAVSVLDEQREALRKFRKQFKASDLDLTDTALEAAWTVKIMEDNERLKSSEADGTTSDGDDDDGYSYGNFLRSIRSEMSTSTSSGALTSMVEELSNSDLTSLRSRSNTHQTVSSMKSKDFRFPKRSSSSPTEEHCLLAPSSAAGVSTANHSHSNSFCRRTDLRISTETIDEVPSGELSPEDREFRHRGPNLTDLNNWAEELRKMEAMHTERRRSPTLRLRTPTRTNMLSSRTRQHSPNKCMTADVFTDRISPTLQLHSRFSSSSSTSTDLLKPLPRPSFASHSPSGSLSISKDESRPIMLDRQYHQHNVSGTSTTHHQRTTSKASTHDSLRQHQRLQSVSSAQISIAGSTKEAENEWVTELERMEGRERSRQRYERVRASQVFEDGGRSEHNSCEVGGSESRGM